MRTEEIEVVVSTEQAEKNVNELKDSINDVGEAGEESGKKASDGINDVGKTAKSTEKAAKGASLGVKAIGTALKAVGIGIIIAAFTAFVDVLTKNQKVADALSSAFGTVSIVMSQIVEILVDTSIAIYEATKGFEALGKVLSGLFTLAITPVKLGFLGIKLAIQQSQLAWEKSFFGDKDPTTIKELNKNISETKDLIIQTGIDAIQAGNDVVNNFGRAIDEVSLLGSSVVNELSKVSISAAYEQSKANTQLKNSAELAEASLQGLIEKYDRLAEQQRQIRDDETKSIAERIAANEELGRILDEQEKAQKKLAGVRVAQAQAELSVNKDSIEAKKALIEATNELAAIEAQVEGFRSEQLVNRNALEKERIEILRELNEIGKTDLELAKEEAAQLRDDRLAQINLQVEDEIEKNRLLIAAQTDYENTITELEKENANARTKIAEREAEAKGSALGSYTNALQNASAIAGKETAAGKALAVASTLTSTYLSAQKAYESQFLPVAEVSSPIRGAIAAAAAVASGLANVKSILSVKVAGQSSGGAQSVGSTQAANTSPSFNLVGRSNVNQLQSGIEEQETAPIRAFVVSQDVTTQQEADRATESQASFG